MKKQQKMSTEFPIVSSLFNNIKAGWPTQLPPSVCRVLEPVLFCAEKEEITVYPPNGKIMECFRYFSLADTKVVILGQDPYINAGEAMGLSFSVPQGSKTPPSLRNIFKELEADLGIKRTNTDLTDWAKQGVLLLNAALTTVAGESGSHMHIWEGWTDHLIKLISKETTGVVFVLLGNFAKCKATLIDASKHHIIKAGHPSPLNRKQDFAGCKLFSECNAYLQSVGKSAIHW